MQNKGKLAIHRLESRVLAGNPLGDPAGRDLYVYVPAGYDAGRAVPYPALLALQGYTGNGAQFFNPRAMGEDLKSQLDRLINSGICPPVVVAAPDCFTRVGGSQYINSSAVGRYEDYLLYEIIPFMKKTYRLGRWGAFGISSGGYGSMVWGMRHPDIIEAVADHSGDSNFELSYIQDAAGALDAFHKAGGPKQWLDQFWKDANRYRSRHMKPLIILGMAAHYSPNPRSSDMRIDFPFDLKTGKFNAEVWKRWQKWDPVRMASRYSANLKKLRAIHIDAGTMDEFTLHWGARALSSELKRLGIRHRHEEYEDGHMGISYRYDKSLPFLVRALQKN